MNFGDVGAVKHIIQNCRARDRAELEALYGLDFTLEHAPAWASQACLLEIFEHDGQPVAFVAAHRMTHTVCLLSMLATEHWRKVAPAVIKWARRKAMPALYLQGFKRAECRSIDGHPEAIRFLLHLGFEVEGYCKQYGRNGETFILFSFTKRKPRNVLRIGQDSSGTQAAAA